MILQTGGAAEKNTALNGNPQIPGDSFCEDYSVMQEYAGKAYRQQRLQ